MFFDDQYSLSIGTVYGIPIHLHHSFLALLALNCLSSVLSGANLESTFDTFIVYGPLLLFTVLVHELGHCFMALRLGGTVECIILWPLGGLSRTSSTATPGDSLKVSIAGPATHIPMILVWKLMLYLLTSYLWDSVLNFGGLIDYFIMIALNAISMNSLLLIFNLIPAYPLDGGQIFASYLTLVKVDTNLAGKISSIVSFLVGVWLLGYGLDMVFLQSYLSANGYIICIFALFVLISGKELYDLSIDGQASRHPLFTHQPRYMPAADLV